MLLNILSFVLSMVVAAVVVPPIIRTALLKRLFDVPAESRKIHKRIIPNMGGVAIFVGFMFCQQLFIQSATMPALNQVLMSGTILFMLGLKDDIVGLSPLKKFAAQFAAAFIVCIIGDVRLISLGGLLGFYELSYVFSIALSVFAIVGIVNAFNLIDGIDGLAGSLGLIISLTFAYLFYHAGETGWVFIALSLSGATAGFLIHNISPAKIFMGDSGSLLLGFFASVMSIHLINVSVENPINIGFTYITSAPALTAALLVIPVFDTLRVFTIRLVRNQSPFKADNNHLHHRLLSLGLNHLQATSILAGITIFFIGFALVLQDMGNSQLIFTIALLIILLNSFFTLYIYSSRKTQFNGPSFDSDLKEKYPNRESLMESNKNFVKSVLEKITEN